MNCIQKDIHLMSHVKVRKEGVTSQHFEIWHKLNLFQAKIGVNYFFLLLF